MKTQNIGVRAAMGTYIVRSVYLRDIRGKTRGWRRGDTSGRDIVRARGWLRHRVFVARVVVERQGYGGYEGGAEGISVIVGAYGVMAHWWAW